MNFQNLIFTLQKFWADNGCALLQPYDKEVGAGTSHPATLLRCLTEEKWNIVYTQPCRRPNDGRYAENPNRMQHYYQMQVILKPSPDEMQELCLQSMREIGLDPKVHDFRFVEDDWENPTLGAWGLGWELWLDGMEVLQFTYMQQIGGVECHPVPGELTYGLERLAMFVQDIENVWDLRWNDHGVTYADIFKESEIESCKYNFETANTEILEAEFANAEKECESLLQANLPGPAYDQCLKAANNFNILEARGVISVTERAAYIARVRNITRKCCTLWVEKYGKKDIKITDEVI